MQTYAVAVCDHDVHGYGVAPSASSPVAVYQNQEAMPQAFPVTQAQPQNVNYIMQHPAGSPQQNCGYAEQSIVMYSPPPSPSCANATHPMEMSPSSNYVQPADFPPHMPFQQSFVQGQVPYSQDADGFISQGQAFPQGPDPSQVPFVQNNRGIFQPPSQDAEGFGSPGHATQPGHYTEGSPMGQLVQQGSYPQPGQFSQQQMMMMPQQMPHPDGWPGPGMVMVVPVWTDDQGNVQVAGSGDMPQCLGGAEPGQMRVEEAHNGYGEMDGVGQVAVYGNGAGDKGYGCAALSAGNNGVNGTVMRQVPDEHGGYGCAARAAGNNGVNGSVQRQVPDEHGGIYICNLSGETSEQDVFQFVFEHTGVQVRQVWLSVDSSQEQTTFAYVSLVEGAAVSQVSARLSNQMLNGRQVSAHMGTPLVTPAGVIGPRTIGGPKGPGLGRGGGNATGSGPARKFGSWNGGGAGCNGNGRDDYSFAGRSMKAGPSNGAQWGGAGPNGYPAFACGGAKGGCNQRGKACGGKGRAASPVTAESQRGDLFVGRLAEGATDANVRELFSKAGLQINYLKLPVDYHDQPKGYAFVTLNDPSQTQYAIETLNGQLINGRPVNVEPSAPSNAAFKGDGKGKAEPPWQGMVRGGCNGARGCGKGEFAPPFQKGGAGGPDLDGRGMQGNVWQNRGCGGGCDGGMNGNWSPDDYRGAEDMDGGAFGGGKGGGRVWARGQPGWRGGRGPGLWTPDGRLSNGGGCARGGAEGPPGVWAPGSKGQSKSGTTNVQKGAASNPHKLFVGNLTTESKAEDVWQALSPAGEIVNVRVLEGKFSGIAFVEFKETSSVDYAVDHMQNVAIRSRHARLERQGASGDARPQNGEQGGVASMVDGGEREMRRAAADDDASHSRDAAAGGGDIVLDAGSTSPQLDTDAGGSVAAACLLDTYKRTTETEAEVVVGA